VGDMDSNSTEETSSWLESGSTWGVLGEECFLEYGLATLLLPLWFYG
jgi:hypothetical protein